MIRTSEPQPHEPCSAPSALVFVNGQVQNFHLKMSASVVQPRIDYLSGKEIPHISHLIKNVLGRGALNTWEQLTSYLQNALNMHIFISTFKKLPRWLSFVFHYHSSPSPPPQDIHSDQVLPSFLNSIKLIASLAGDDISMETVSYTIPEKAAKASKRAYMPSTHNSDPPDT